VCIAAPAAIATAEAEGTLAVAGFAVRSSLAEAGQVACSAEAVGWASPVADSVAVSVLPAAAVVVPARPVVAVVCSVRRPVR
jgi:hypothetical protein